MGADRTGLLSEVFAMLDNMECSIMEACAWTHRGCLPCVAFLRGEDPDAGRVARILARLGHLAYFYSAPASPTRGGPKDFGAAAVLLDFDFSSPSPSAAAMSSADELFCNGQIRHIRLAAALLQPPQPHGDAAAAPGSGAAKEDECGGGGGIGAAPDERDRVRAAPCVGRLGGRCSRARRMRCWLVGAGRRTRCWAVGAGEADAVLGGAAAGRGRRSGAWPSPAPTRTATTLRPRRAGSTPRCSPRYPWSR